MIINNKQTYNNILRIKPLYRRLILIGLDTLIIFFSFLSTHLFLNNDNNLKNIFKFSDLLIYFYFFLSLYIFTNQYRSLTRYTKEKSFFSFRLKKFNFFYRYYFYIQLYCVYRNRL